MKKNILYIALAFASILFASCMGESYADANLDDVPVGNNTITESNLVTIAQLKDMYKTVINTDYRNGLSYKKVEENLQIKGIVTSSDIQGNVYNELYLQDETGAIVLSVAQGGLYSLLPVGSEILVELKDLYVGNYGLQAEIGVPTTNKSLATSIGKMSRATFDQHYRILSSGNMVEPEVFDINKWDLEKDGGKLAVLKNVSFKFNSADSTYATADAGAGSKSWSLKEIKNVIVYNSNYADFANAKVPTGKVNITGMMKRYNNQWELIIRTLDDVKEVTDPYEGVAGKGKGTEADPYDVTRALGLIAAGTNNPDADVYIKGIISSIDNIDTGSYGNGTYFISIDGTEANQLEIFRGYYLNGDKFTKETAKNMVKGKEVVILGKLVNYNGTPEVTSRSKIISIK